MGWSVVWCGVVTRETELIYTSLVSTILFFFFSSLLPVVQASHRDERSWAIAVRNILDRVKALWENFSQAARSDKMVVEKSAFVSQADRPLTDIFIERMFAEHTQSRYVSREDLPNDEDGDEHTSSPLFFFLICFVVESTLPQG